MGASESKLVFKQGIFRLSEEQRIAANDQYWTGFWELPDSTEDVFSLFSPTDIRRARDSSIENLETLLLAITSRLNVLKNHPSFPDPELAPEKHALNCIRVLTRLLPYIYEAEHLSDWEEKFFWGVRRRRTRKSQLAGEVLFDEEEYDNPLPRDADQSEWEDTKPLAEELIDTLTDLLFYADFSIPRLPNTKSKVNYAIWQSGVGCKTSIGASKEHESNRCEVLRLLLTLTSKAMYMSSTILPVQGVKAVTYLVTCPEKQIVLSMLCSFLNTTIKHNSSSWRLPYDHMVWKDSKQALVVYSIQFLLVLLLYPVPEDVRGVAPKNYYRHFLGRLHRPEDFQFLADGMTRLLSQPMQATSSYLPGSQKSVRYAPEMIMLFWEMLQSNKRFRSFIIESNRAHDFTVLMLFYGIENKSDPLKQGVVRMCIFVLQTMSVEPVFGKNLNKRFEGQETLPSSIRLSSFRGSYADFLIISIHTLITGSKGKLDTIYPALLAIINNIAAYVQNLSMTASSKLVQLLAAMSTPSFLLANESNHQLLQSQLEAINTIIEHQYTENPNLIYAVLRSKKRFEALRTFTLEGGHEELEKAARKRKETLDNGSWGSALSPTRSITSPTSQERTSEEQRLSNEQDNTFTIADSDDSDNENDQPTPSQSSPPLRNSRAPSIASSSIAEDAVPMQLRGMSEKARGKLPASQHSFSRQNSTTSLSSSATLGARSGFEPSAEWLHSWLPDLPLHTTLTLIKALHPLMPSAPTTNSSSSPITSRRPSLADGETASSLTTFLQSLPSTSTHPQISPMLSSPSTIRIHLFEWSPLSLGWYMSVLYSLIYTAEMTIAPTSTSSSSITSTITGSGMPAGPIGVWNGTQVRLFGVTEGKREGPSLGSPRGAVDAVGSRLVQGVQGLGLGGLMRRTSANAVASVQGGQQDGMARGMSVREI